MTCLTCDGDGYIIYSCCGDDIKSDINETDICPSCGEHCGCEKEDCEECEGTGEYPPSCGIEMESQ